MKLLKTQHLFAGTFLLCAMVLLMSPHVTAQVVNIPNPGLRATFEDSLGRAAGAPITRADMATLTYINGDDRGIRDLTGLEFAINLEGFDFRHNIAPARRIGMGGMKSANRWRVGCISIR